MQNLTGKVAFITGGASGMGLAMARSFSAAGMKVVVADVEQQALDAVSAEFAQQSNAELLALRVDVTDRQAMAEAADAVEARFGKVHVLVNNAGVAVGGTLDSMSYADWDWVTGVNLDGVVNGLQVFIERIKRHGEGGHIVNTASMAGHLAIPSLGVYNATKWAVVGISETLHTELAPHRIGVSVLCPGLVATNIFDSQRNRPDGLQAVQGSDTSLTAITEEAQAAMQTALDPAVVGEMVLTAIQENDLYVFTHPEFKEHVLTRYQAVGEAFDRWQAYRQDLPR